MGRLNVMDVIREQILFALEHGRRNGVGQRCLFWHEGFKVSVCLQKNEAAWKACTLWGLRNRQEVSQRRSCDRQSTVCGLFQIKSDFIKTRPKSPPPSWHNQSMLSGSSQEMGHEAEHGSWHTLENGGVQLWCMHMPSDDSFQHSL